MLDAFGFIIYLVLVFLTVISVCSVRKGGIKYGVGVINATFVFIVGFVIIPLFKLPILLCSLFFIIVGLVVSVISVMYPNRFFKSVAKLTVILLFVDLSKEEIMMRCGIKDNTREHSETFDDTDDMNKDGDTNQDDE